MPATLVSPAVCQHQVKKDRTEPDLLGLWKDCWVCFGFFF